MNEAQKPDSSSEELKKIEAVLEKSIRPHLKSHGGDLKLLSLAGNVLSVSYQGACGGCPHATMGTLMAIEDVLKKEYNPDIKVQPNM